MALVILHSNRHRNRDIIDAYCILFERKQLFALTHVNMLLLCIDLQLADSFDTYGENGCMRKTFGNHFSKRLIYTSITEKQLYAYY